MLCGLISVSSPNPATYLPGSQHANADGMSRQCGQCQRPDCPVLVRAQQQLHSCTAAARSCAAAGTFMRSSSSFVRSSSSFVRSSRYIRAQQQLVRAQQQVHSCAAAARSYAAAGTFMRSSSSFVRSSSSFVRSSRCIRAQQQLVRAQQNCPSGPPYPAVHNPTAEIMLNMSLDLSVMI